MGEIILHPGHPDYCKECVYYIEGSKSCTSKEYDENSYSVVCVWHYCPYKRKKGEEEMSLEDARKILFAYVCCAVGTCEIFPCIGDSPHSPCEGERLFDIKEAVETVAKELGTVEEYQKAIEKQKPKKPSEIDEEFGYFVCGNCGTAIYASDDFESHHYCLNCGQAIDWTAEGEESRQQLAEREEREERK